MLVPNDPLSIVVVILAALLASTVAAVAGFGGAVVLLPVLVWTFRVRDAVPILTVIQLVGNFSRVLFNRRELVLPVVGWFALGAVPLAILGGLLFASAPAPLLKRLPGAFLLIAVAYRHTSFGSRARLSLRGFAGGLVPVHVEPSEIALPRLLAEGRLPRLRVSQMADGATSLRRRRAPNVLGLAAS